MSNLTDVQLKKMWDEYFDIQNLENPTQKDFDRMDELGLVLSKYEDKFFEVNS